MSGKHWGCFFCVARVKVLSALIWKQRTHTQQETNTNLCLSFTAVLRTRWKPFSFFLRNIIFERIRCFEIVGTKLSPCCLKRRQNLQGVMNNHPNIVWQRQSISMFRCINIKQQVSIFFTVSHPFVFGLCCGFCSASWALKPIWGLRSSLSHTPTAPLIDYSYSSVSFLTQMLKTERH